MEKQEPSLQINFSIQFGWRHQIYRRVEVKWREVDRVGGIFMRYPVTWVWFGPRTDAALLFSLCMGFSSCCHGNCKLSWRWWVCHLVLQCTYNEAQGLLEVKSALLGLVGSKQFLFFSLCSFLLKLR